MTDWHRGSVDYYITYEYSSHGDGPIQKPPGGDWRVKAIANGKSSVGTPITTIVWEKDESR
jgi:hypothetical protein